MAAGTDVAEHKPMRLQRTFRKIGIVAKPTIRRHGELDVIPDRRTKCRPNRSAALSKKCRKEPAANLKSGVSQKFIRGCSIDVA